MDETIEIGMRLCETNNGDNVIIIQFKVSDGMYFNFFFLDIGKGMKWIVNIWFLGTYE